MLIIYFATDHPLYFHNVGLKTYDKAALSKLDYINNVFWLANSVLDIVCTIADMQHIQNEIKKIVSFSTFFESKINLYFVCSKFRANSHQMSTTELNWKPWKENMSKSVSIWHVTLSICPLFSSLWVTDSHRLKVASSEPVPVLSHYMDYTVRDLI